MTEKMMKTERTAENTNTKQTGTKRLLHCLWTALIVALPATTNASGILWDSDDYLVAHQGLIKVYDHDFTFKGIAQNGYGDTHSLTWTPEGLLRTANDTATIMVDVGPDSSDSVHAHPYRYLRLNGSDNGISGDIKIAPDGAMFFGMAQPFVVKKFTIGPDQTTNTAGAEVAADATEAGAWDGGTKTLRYGVTVVPNTQYGYVIWVGSEMDYISVLKPDLTQIPFDQGGVVRAGGTQTAVSMYYDPKTSTVLAGWEAAPSTSGTQVAVEMDAETGVVAHKFYVPYTSGADTYLINGITRGADGIVVAADSGNARIYIWNADGTYVRSVTMTDNRGGFDYSGERASTSIVWAGNRPARLLTAERQGTDVIISWTGVGTLQAAPFLTGPWSNVSGATNPLAIPPETQVGQQFYRLWP